MNDNHKPTQVELLAAAGKVVQDVIAPDLELLFCGINPGLYTAAVGHHFARPGNRFWPTLYAAGFTNRLLAPSEERGLLARGLGITNIVARASARADELSPDELAAGAQQLGSKIQEYRPRYLAVLGISAYRVAFDRPRATLGRQPEALHNTVIWALPNPSGLNAHYQARDLSRLFAELRAQVEGGS